MIDKVSVVEAVRRALDELNALPNPDAIARHLREAGARGYRASPSSCPVATFLRRRSGAHTVSVSYTWGVRVQVNADGPRHDVSPVRGSVFEFVTLFDEGRHYQDLGS